VHGSSLAPRSRLAAVLDSLPDCVKVLSVDGVIRFVNVPGLALMEAEATAELVGKNYADFWPDLGSNVLKAIRAAADGRETGIEGKFVSLKGTSRWGEALFKRVESAEPNEIEVISVTRDTAARHTRELQLRSNEERLSLILESAGDGIYEMDPDGRCTFVNSSGAKMLGYNRDELLGRSLHDAIHHHRTDGTPYALEDCPIFKATLNGQPDRIDDEVFWQKDGRSVVVSYAVFPIKSSAARHGAVVTFTDMTDRKRNEEALRRLAAELSEADRRKSEFIATLAHELRNPLVPVRTGLQIIRKTGDDPAAIARVREMMERHVGQMVHLINDLLDIARVTSGKLELKKERVEFQGVLSMAIEASGPIIGNARQTLTVDMRSTPLLLNADPTRLAQIFTNLLNNASKYTPAEGRITVLVRSSETDVTVEIADTGIGMDQQSLEPIFEMFTKVGPDPGGATAGLGIGLNLVRRLVELHAGRVVARSAGIGKGSSFIITLPLAPSIDQVAGVQEVPGSEARPGESLRAMVVDDNRDAAASLSMLLEAEHHTTLVANGGREALRLITAFRPDIVFLDIGMPDMSGYEVARAIRQKPELGNPVLVALTGWGGAEDRLQAKKAGFDEHLTKPADLSTIEQLLSLAARHNDDQPV
jgi:PAS domain S-box-containing protein